MKITKYLATVLALAGMSGPVLAAPGAAVCATDADMAAFRTAAVQQQLMVAALTCHDIDAYNRFVVMYRPELQKSDAELKAYFIKKGSEAEYDTFKTKLANLSSLSNIANGPAYCANAGAAFDIALRSRQPLASFVADQRLMIALPKQNMCTNRPLQALAAPPARLAAPAKPPLRVARVQPPAPPVLAGVPSHDLPATPYGAVPEQSYRDYDEARPAPRASDERQAFNDTGRFGRADDPFDDEVAGDYRARNDYDEQAGDDYDDADLPPPPQPRAYQRYRGAPAYPYWWPRGRGW
jgi:hypothetical protein